MGNRSGLTPRRAPAVIGLAGVGAVAMVAGLAALVPPRWEGWRSPQAATPTMLILDHKVTAVDPPVNVEGEESSLGLAATEQDAGAEDDAAGSDAAASVGLGKVGNPGTSSARSTPPSSFSRSHAAPEYPGAFDPRGPTGEGRGGMSLTPDAAELTPLAIDHAAAIATAQPTQAAASRPWDRIQVSGSL